MFYVEASPAGRDEWRPVNVVFGAGRYECLSKQDAAFEVGLWTVPARQRGYVLRSRPGAKAPKEKSAERGLQEAAVQAKVADAKARRAQAETNLLKARK